MSKYLPTHPSLHGDFYLSAVLHKSYSVLTRQIWLPVKTLNGKRYDVETTEYSAAVGSSKN